MANMRHSISDNSVCLSGYFLGDDGLCHFSAAGTLHASKTPGVLRQALDLIAPGGDGGSVVKHAAAVGPNGRRSAYRPIAPPLICSRRAVKRSCSYAAHMVAKFKADASLEAEAPRPDIDPQHAGSLVPVG